VNDHGISEQAKVGGFVTKLLNQEMYEEVKADAPFAQLCAFVVVDLRSKVEFPVQDAEMLF
jgi:hypothetical protein